MWTLTTTALIDCMTEESIRQALSVLEGVRTSRPVETDPKAKRGQSSFVLRDGEHATFLKAESMQ